MIPQSTSKPLFSTRPNSPQKNPNIPHFLFYVLFLKFFYSVIWSPKPTVLIFPQPPFAQFSICFPSSPALTLPARNGTPRVRVRDPVNHQVFLSSSGALIFLVPSSKRVFLSLIFQHFLEKIVPRCLECKSFSL